MFLIFIFPAPSRFCFLFSDTVVLALALSLTIWIQEQRKAHLNTNAGLGLDLKASLVSTGFLGNGGKEEGGFEPKGNCTDRRRRGREGESRERRREGRSTSSRRGSEEGAWNQPWARVWVEATHSLPLERRKQDPLFLFLLCFSAVDTRAIMSCFSRSSRSGLDDFNILINLQNSCNTSSTEQCVCVCVLYH